MATLTKFNQVQIGQEVSVIVHGGYARGVVQEVKDDQVSIEYETKSLGKRLSDPMVMKKFNIVLFLSKGELFLVS